MDRVDLIREYGVDRQRAWRDRATAASNCQRIVFGRLGDRRWFADRQERDGAYVFAADQQGHDLALRLAYRWMRDCGRPWFATPAGYRDGEPADGLPWVRRGGEWFLEAETMS